jgi:hypothetical protein
MEPLTIITWQWGTKYPDGYVERLRNGLERSIAQPFRFYVMKPDAGDPLLDERGCFVRLHLFDPQWQGRFGLTGRIVQIDLDVVITGALDPLFDRPEPLVILQGANSANPCPFNGSLMMLRTGAHPEVWSEFSLPRAAKIPFYQFPDDQGWIYHMAPAASGWQAGRQSGVWSFRKATWPPTDLLPPGARMVCFPGARDPSQYLWMPWIKAHWK